VPHHKLSEAHQQGQALMHHPDINAAARYATYLVLLSAGRLGIQGEPEAV
jgi:ABC-type hemin transport system ATPase subunit